MGWQWVCVNAALSLIRTSVIFFCFFCFFFFFSSAAASLLPQRILKRAQPTGKEISDKTVDEKRKERGRGDFKISDFGVDERGSVSLCNRKGKAIL